MDEILNGTNPAGDDRLIADILAHAEAHVAIIQAEAAAVRRLEDEAARIDSEITWGLTWN